jgi:hypothetical protein
VAGDFMGTVVVHKTYFPRGPTVMVGSSFPYICMKRLLMIAVTAIILVGCKNTRPPLVTYECTNDFEIREEPDRTITLRDTTYYFWSIRDCGTGEVKCFISVKRDKNFKELYDR